MKWGPKRKRAMVAVLHFEEGVSGALLVRDRFTRIGRTQHFPRTLSFLPRSQVW